MAFAQARPSRPLGSPLAHARITGALFHGSAAGQFGRFHVRERLGAGGMGVVYAAHDPKLDRGVALKLVRVAENDHEAALVEAQTLAQLSHPNVVPIYDVGIEEEDVFLVMELVRGATLRRWVAGKSWRAILRVYRQAGAALAAAHRAGLVHRDFKPDNAIVGADGRVRVVDFGLACKVRDSGNASAQRTEVAGTLRYMAPEQLAGSAATPAADQYSFCVALAEALGTCAPGTVPRWVEAAVQRGRSLDPDARFSSMRELVRVLSRDPGRARLQGLGIAVLAGAVGIAAFVIGAARGHRDEMRCAGAPEHAAWTSATRTAAIARFDQLGGYDRTLAPRAIATLDDHGQRWTTAYRAACLDHVRGENSDAMFEHRARCLRRSRDAVDAVVAIIEHATPDTLAGVPRAIAALPDPARCTELSVILADSDPPPPDRASAIAEAQARVTQARMQVEAATVGASALAAEVVAEARALNYAPLLAEALIVEGRARMTTARALAIPSLLEATNVAMAARLDALAIEAWARRAWAQATSTDTVDPDSALAGLDVIEVLALRTGGARFARALLYNNLGSVELSRDHRGRAAQVLERALVEARGLTGPEQLELVNVQCNLALAIDDRARSDALLTGAIAELTRQLGAEHPDTLAIRWIRGGQTVEPLAMVAEELTGVCRGWELHPALEARAAECWMELALVQDAQGDRATAIAAMERAERSRTLSAKAAPFLLSWRGDPAAAARRFGDAVAALPAVAGEPWWVREKRAELQAFHGRALRDARRHAEARRSLAASVTELAELARDHPAATYERRLGRARVDLALVLVELGAPARELQPIAEAAVSWLRRVRGPARELAAIERLLPR